MSRRFALALALTVALSCALLSRSGAEPLRGPYFGQEPPGRAPVLFAPDIFNNQVGYHSAVVFSPDGKEAYFAPMSRDPRVFVMRRSGETWGRAEALEFDSVKDGGDPALSPDGERLYFLSFQATESEPAERERIWFAERSGAGWGRPRMIDPCIAAHPTHWTFSVAANGNLYFTSETGERQSIFLSRFEEGRYLDPIDLGPSINGPDRNFCPFVSADERFLVFARSGAGTKRADLFVSFRTAEGGWTAARRLGEPINSDGHDLAPVVSSDGEYLFFLSMRDGRSRPYWVEASVLEDERPSGN